MQYELKPGSPWMGLGCASLMGFAMFSSMLCVPPIMHIIKKEFLLSHAQVSLVFGLPLFALAVLAIPSGVLADGIGIKKAGSIGVLVMTVGSLLRGISQGFPSLIAFTFIFGIGLGLIFPNLPKLVSTFFPLKRGGLATGIYSIAIVFGCALSLAITLPLVYPITNSFQGVFYIWTIPAIVAGILWWIAIPEDSRGLKKKRVINKNGPTDLIWSNGNLWIVAIQFFVCNFANYTWAGWTPQLMMMKGASPGLAGFMTSGVLWVCIPTVLCVPWASDKIGLRRPFIFSAFILLALASLIAIYAPLSLGWLVVVLAGVSVGSQFAMLLTLPPALVKKEAVGRASGMILSVGYVGGLVGPFVGGYILDRTGTLNLQLFIQSGLAVLAALLVIRLAEGVQSRDTRVP